MGFFQKLFGRDKSSQRHNPLPHPLPLPQGPQAKLNPMAFSSGDMIALKYQIQKKLGEGGFGTVYLVRNRETHQVSALKTFRDELLADSDARGAFKKEATLWVNLGDHPNILVARWIIEFFGRVFVEMDYVAPDSLGRVTLADHLSKGEQIDIDQALEWAIQFCVGMGHAKANGLRVHRDIKPANILITKEKVLKISDFGLAAAAEAAWRKTEHCRDLLGLGHEGEAFRIGISQVDGKVRCGTPGYMPPEVYRCEGADVRSDIYSLGLALWQMVVGSNVPPFIVMWKGNMDRYLHGIYEQQMANVVSVEGAIGKVIRRCLNPNPTERYVDFDDLRQALVQIWEQRCDRHFPTQQANEMTAASWNTRGGSLESLGRNDEALFCFDRALAIDPRCLLAWCSKGRTLISIGHTQKGFACFEKAMAIDPGNAIPWRFKAHAFEENEKFEDAVCCYDKVLAIDSQDASTWLNKGALMAAGLSRYDEAIECFDRALAIQPRCAVTWDNKGSALAGLGKYEEALKCHQKSLMIDSHFLHASYNMGHALAALGKHGDAINSYGKALAIDPHYAPAWYDIGVALSALFRHQEAISAYDKALALDPHYTGAWYNRGVALAAVGLRQEAIESYQKAVAIDSGHTGAWINQGADLGLLGRHEMAIKCYEKALTIDPADACTWYNKALSEESLGRSRDEIASYRKFLELAPPQFAQQIAQARQRLRVLELGAA